MMRRRVKITGIGPVTPVGIGTDAFFRGVVEGGSRVRAQPQLERPGTGPFVAADIRDFDFNRYFPEIPAKRYPRHSHFALVGAQLALADAGLSASEVAARNPLIVVGASLMDFGVINHTMDLILKKGKVLGFPSAVVGASVASIAGAIAEWVGGHCRTLALQSACCAGTDAIGHAVERVASGEAEIALCGGTEAPLHLHPMVELKKARLSSDSAAQPEKSCRPFDRWRTTGAIGEGASIFVLEPEGSPRPGYAFIDGYAYATDAADHLLGGLEQAIRLALGNARVSPGDIDCVSAWGPGHSIIDTAESRVLAEIFGPRLSSIPACSIKGAVGNPLGAAGPMQLAAAALGMARGILPPTVNWEYPDSECPLCLGAKPRYLRYDKVLIDAHGLSGTNASLVVVRGSCSRS